MSLQEWLEANSLTRAEGARRLGVTRGHFTDLADGRFWPSREMMKRVMVLTNGAVTPNDFLDRVELRRR